VIYNMYMDTCEVEDVNQFRGSAIYSKIVIEKLLEFLDANNIRISLLLIDRTGFNFHFTKEVMVFFWNALLLMIKRIGTQVFRY